VIAAVLEDVYGNLSGAGYVADWGVLPITLYKYAGLGNFALSPLPPQPSPAFFAIITLI
jgi:hypothetical protein